MDTRKKVIGAAALAAATMIVGAVQAGGLVFHEPGDTPYLAFEDSPFAGNGSFNYFHLEDFEDGTFDIAGVTISAGSVLNPSSSTDSVDADDGLIDGFGTGGHSWFVRDAAGADVTFSFDGDVLGGLPTHAGVVWTDGLDGGNVTFDVFDGDGALVDSFETLLGIGDPNGTTAEDRFLGVEFLDGISAIRVVADQASIELDHFQIGQATPAPGGLAVLLGGLIMGRCRRRTG